MEREAAVAAAEGRRAPRVPRQRGRAPAESPEATPAGGPHAVLEGKVKALKEKRGAGRLRARRAKTGPEAAEPRAQVRTYLTDGLLDGAADAATAPGAAPASTGRSSAGGPWRLPGDSSSSGGLSLAQRVERNRQLLQEVLGLAPGRAAAGWPQDDPAHEPPSSDAGQDSGVSLLDADACSRAVVAGPALALSPRHEQAKQLLQRARMKARANPLRASHELLVAAAREPRGTPAPEPTAQDGDLPASGSLSDSSSGESSGGARRARGPSPSRVRFEDESVRDAEVRYLERLQLRQRRTLGSVLGSLAHGPPPALPGPAARGSDSEQQSRGIAQDAAGPDKVPGAGGTCRTCGSLLGAPAISSDVGRAAERAEASASPPEPRARTLGPRGSPLWILPSRQRIHTERIRETYIGDVTYVDDVDSALESTDTSDGCRTDSEEGGPRGPHLSPQDTPRPRGHDALPARRPERERCCANSGRDARGPSGSAERPSPANRPEGPSQAVPHAASAGGREAAGGPPGAPSPQPGLKRPVPGVPVRGCPPAPHRKAGGPRAPSPKPAVPAEMLAPGGARHFPGSPLSALSTNNCNNTRGQVLSEGRGAQKPSVQEQRCPEGRGAGSAAPESPSSHKGGGTAGSGLRKLLCSLSQGTKQRLGRFRCYSMEQLAAPGPVAPGPAVPAVRRSPSLQSLPLVASPGQPRRAASVQSLQSLLARAPRASAYLLPADGKAGRAPRRTLSLEDISAPDLPRAVGRVLEVFPDGTSQLELRRPPDGAFGFRLASGHGRPDTGIYVQEMADAGTAKLYAGLLAVGDEILQVNGVAVSGLAPAQLQAMLLHADTLSLRVLRQRPPRR